MASGSLTAVTGTQARRTLEGDTDILEGKKKLKAIVLPLSDRILTVFSHQGGHMDMSQLSINGRGHARPDDRHHL